MKNWEFAIIVFSYIKQFGLIWQKLDSICIVAVLINLDKNYIQLLFELTCLVCLCEKTQFQHVLKDYFNLFGALEK